ncbi:cytochrome c oxidase assembly protein [Abyssibius alkaniclasticus]|uniref:cytochrome c oxidase assembly protein n=1 Tax=Abyssibius alkaniclasticus TaxID=2881234 RepID=UPI0023631D01|nr:cytochrome c oxidase assembly protein [Abyssibius alkaniclasticus]UPH70107.1 cytochrome c oxidase assembly protein [Abyssibius alkaniclasticus]
MQPNTVFCALSRQRNRLAKGFGLVAGLAAPTAARAHGGEGLLAADAFRAWSVTPEISGALLLILVIYIRGALRRRSVAAPASASRHVLFAGGILALFLSLQSPIDPMGERLFLAHQIQHLLLRMVGPMLVVLARPQGLLIAGTPEVLRRWLLAPMLANGAVSGLYNWMTGPLTAFVLFLLSLYVWQIPPIHNAALLDPLIHWAMHLTMLAGGLLFFAMIFGRRDLPTTPPHSLRIALLFAGIVSNILLGAITVFKTTVLYTAYDIEGRLFGIAPLSDETAGGFILWVPGSMMLIIAIMIVVFDWNRTEGKRLDRGHDMAGSGKAGSPAQAAAARKRLALLLGLGVLAMFSLIIGTAVFILSIG